MCDCGKNVVDLSHLKIYTIMAKYKAKKNIVLIRNGKTFVLRKSSQEELSSRGANFSLIHVDFMIGGPELEIIAYEKDGSTVQLFKEGNWAF